MSKKNWANFVLAMAEHNSRDAEAAKEYLKEQGIDVTEEVKWLQWLTELRKITKERRRDEDFILNAKEAYKWYTDGFTPEQCFRETWEMEND